VGYDGQEVSWVQPNAELESLDQRGTARAH
jgi:hypothetical protein